MLVTMTAPTYYGDKRLKKGDAVEVPDEIAARWQKAKIADVDAKAAANAKADADAGKKADDAKAKTDADADAAAKKAAEEDAKADADAEEILKAFAAKTGPGSAMTVSQLEKSGTPTLEKLAAKRGLDISAAKNNAERAKIIFADINKGKE